MDSNVPARHDYHHDGAQDHHDAGTVFTRWLSEWLAPPTLISLIFFGGLVSVAHYRLGQVEVQIAEIRAEVSRDRDAMSVVYQRRDVMIEQLRQIQTQLDEIKGELRERRRLENRRLDDLK